MKKERSIPFTTEEVRATFDGRKTQKRISIKPQPKEMKKEYAEQKMQGYTGINKYQINFVRRIK